MDKPENPPAFPRVSEGLGINRPGMTLRDWFAGQALAGQLASVNADDAAEFKRQGDEWTRRMFAEHAYSLADAMLAARTQSKEGRE